MIQAQSKALSLKEFLKLPETKPASEYIAGQIIQKPMPQGRHSSIQGELVLAINAGVKSKKIACAFPELRCTFVCQQAKPYGQRFVCLVTVVNLDWWHISRYFRPAESETPNS